MTAHPPNGADPGDINGNADLPLAVPSSDVPGLVRKATIAFLGVAALALGDLLSDGVSGLRLEHVLLEGAVLVLALGAIWSLRRTVHRTGHEVQSLRGQVAQWQAEADRWRRESSDLLKGLGAAMDEQFSRWELSPAEREVALLLVKGLSSNEIANVRQTSERTVRQQSQAVYRKAGLAGRAELAAFFLEDLLLPGSIAQVGRENVSRTG